MIIAFNSEDDFGYFNIYDGNFNIYDGNITWYNNTRIGVSKNL